MRVLIIVLVFFYYNGLAQMKNTLNITRTITTTDGGAFWQENNQELKARKTIRVKVDIDQPLQTIDGFGGCFNEKGWEVLQTLDEKEREKVYASLFDMENGCRFTLYRMPIGANDYAIDWYSHNETSLDFSMQHFSIDRDRQRLVPYVKKAMEYNPHLKIFASPWCPPSWMKTNGHYACRTDPNVNDLPEERQGKEMVDQFIMEEPYLDTYALYFSKFVSAYKNEGINIYSVHVQNEPNSCQNFPSCVWTPASLARFISKHLGPTLNADHPDIELWLGTIERPQPERVDVILTDEHASKYIKGVGFQWAGKGVIEHVNKQYPNMELMQTETECGDGSNDWAAMEYTFDLMKHYFANGTSSYLYWNMVLDHTGSSQWGWNQNSMITIGENGEVVYNPEFYLMKHFSYFVRNGARYVKTSDNNSVAFVNPDKQLIIVSYNNEDKPVNKEINVGGSKTKVALEGKSLATLVVQL